jgi:hypothetical protein
MLNERFAHVDLLRCDLRMPARPCGDGVTVGPFITDDFPVLFEFGFHVVHRLAPVTSILSRPILPLHRDRQPPAIVQGRPDGRQIVPATDLARRDRIPVAGVLAAYAPNFD